MNQSQQQLFPLTAAHEARADERFREMVGIVGDVLHTSRDALYGTRCRVAVCGGAARDIALGIVPRDIDLVVCPTNEDDVYVILKALELGLGYRIEKDFCHDNDGFLWTEENDPDYESVASDDRWSRVVKLVAPNKPGVDILVSTHGTIDEAIQAFDFNINQFAILFPYCAPRFFGTGQGELIHNRTANVSADRIQRIKSIARVAGWVYNREIY